MAPSFLPRNVENSKRLPSPARPLFPVRTSPTPHRPVPGRGLTHCPSLSLPGRILDLKTGTVKKEGQQSSMRMCMGSRRSFICRMRCVGRLYRLCRAGAPAARSPSGAPAVLPRSRLVTWFPRPRGDSPFLESACHHAHPLPCVLSIPFHLFPTVSPNSPDSHLLTPCTSNPVPSSQGPCFVLRPTDSIWILVFLGGQCQHP